MTTLYTNNRLGGILMAEREQLVMPIDMMSMPTISIGNTVDSALPVLTTDFTQPQLMPRAHVLASLDELGKKAGNKALRQHYDELMLSIGKTRHTHYWVA